MIRKLKGDEAVEKTRLKTVKRRRINAFLPVPVEPLPEPLRQAEQDLFPAFQPPFRIDYVAFQYLHVAPTPVKIYLDKPTSKMRGQCKPRQAVKSVGRRYALLNYAGTIGMRRNGCRVQ